MKPSIHPQVLLFLK